jgi:hypothetical protein
MKRLRPLFEEQIQKDDEKIQETQRQPAALTSPSPEIKAVQEEIPVRSPGNEPWNFPRSIFYENPWI